MTLLDKQTVIERYCKLTEEVCDHIGYDHPADCFCGQGGFWSAGNYDGTISNGYRNDGTALEFIENAVREKIARQKNAPYGEQCACAPEKVSGSCPIHGQPQQQTT